MANVARGIVLGQIAGVTKGGQDAMRRTISILAAACCALMPAGCASLSAQANDPLLDASETHGYRLASFSSNRSSDDLLVVVSFSGGGKRSAAFGYGALMAMRDITFTYKGETRNLLHEIDILTGVSGGSFPAAYYALHRDSMFQTFRKDFLDEDLNDEIAGIYLLPWRWDWMVNPNWGTNDEMARVYDDKMFHGATFEDLEKLGPPFVMVQATDLANGAPFPFAQSQFDMICSNLSTYPLARAVAASNGFPILFTPIVLTNYRDNCDIKEPAWVTKGMADPDPLSRQRQQAMLARRYMRVDGPSYVHLIDGGVGDNLAMRGLLDYISRYDNPAQAPDPDGNLKKLTRVLFISIDGQADQDREISRAPIVGDLLRIANAVTSNTIDRYNFETLRLARSAAHNLADNLTELRCSHGGKGPGARSEMVHIALSEQPDADALKEIPTGLTISKAQVDQLIEAGEAAVSGDANLAQFLAEADTADACPASVAAK